jgi:hypothetical protein
MLGHARAGEIATGARHPMPANLTPEYKAAEAAYRKARDPRERLECLREMLRTMPKHKGTDHLQAEVKTRIRELTEELSGPKRAGAHTGPATVIRPEGAAQIALLGPPNSGKSSLHDRLTGSGAPRGPYPFTTQYPQPGMLAYLDIAFQLVDLPPIAREHPIAWLAGALQPADACLLVVDLGEPDCVDQVATVIETLGGRRVTLTARWGRAGPPEREASPGDPFALTLPALLVASKADRLADLGAELGVFRELSGLDFPALAASAETGRGLSEIGPWLFEHLGVVRVYTKAPGRPADRERPFTLRRGQTVLDVATLVHKDLAHSLKYARLWRAPDLHGLQVGRDQPLADGDVVELHT